MDISFFSVILTRNEYVSLSTCANISIDQIPFNKSTG